MEYSDFKYINVAFGSVQNRKDLIEITKLKPFAENWKKQHGDLKDFYKTYFRYPQGMLEHFNKYKSVRGYTGPCYADFLPIDIDSSDLPQSHETVKRVLIYFQDVYEIDLRTVRIYFSGSKGFHIEIPFRLFGFEPSRELHHIFKEIAFKLIPEGVTIDGAIYDKTRLWRLANTINSKSGLYKIPLSSDELFNLSIEEIQKLAMYPRRGGSFYDPNVSLNLLLNGVYKDALKDVSNNHRRLSQTDSKKYKALLESGVNEGDRNSTLASFAGVLKAKGISKEEAEVLLKAINKSNCKPPIDDQEVGTILNSVYSYPNELEFKTMAWAELIGQEEPEIEFLIEGLLPVGCLLILAGKPKLGKSLLALLFAISVSLGIQLWDKRVNQGGVLFISTEDGVIRLKKRIWKMLGNPNKHNPNCHFFVGNCILTDKKVMEALKAKVVELKPKLIILDPLINLFKGKELNSGEDMNAVLRPLQELAKETGACVLVIHHARKSSGEDSIDVIQGSITISGVADGLLIMRSLKSDDEEKRAVLEVILKDAEIPNKVVLKLNDNLKWDVEGEFEEVTNKNIGNEVIKALGEENGLSIYDLKEITGYTYKQLYKAMINLEREEKVTPEKRGKSHKKVFFLSRENEGKAKRESEKQDVTNGNDSKNQEGKSSLSRFPNLYKESDIRESEHSEACDCDLCVND